MTTNRPHAKVTLGVIGYGYWGPNLVRNFHKMEDVHLKTVCDLNPDRLVTLESLYPDILLTPNIEAVLGDEEIGAVVIATPFSTHYELAKRCLEAGKHVLIEKPMASSVRECLDLVELAAHRSLTLMVGHLTRFMGEVRKIRDLVESGDLGEIHTINSRRMSLGLFQKDHNVLWDLATHDIATILYLTDNMPLTVNCQGKSFVTPSIEDVCTLTMDFGKKQLATVQSSWLDPHKIRSMTIVGSRKMVSYDDCEPAEKLRIYDKRVEAPPRWDSFQEFTYSYHYGDVLIPQIPWTEPLAIECRHFADCVELGQRPLVDGLEGARVVSILEAASQSLKQNGAPVKVEPIHRNYCL